VRWVCKDIADERSESANCGLSGNRISCAVHLCEKHYTNRRANNSAHSGQFRVLKTKSLCKFAPCHHKKTGKPSSHKLLDGRTYKSR